MPKFFAILLIVLGEIIAIGAEMFLVRHFQSDSIVLVIISALISVTVAAGFLILGYAMSYKAFKNIWIVSALSIASIVIIEPILAWLLFHEIPTLGAVIGLFCGVLGIVSSLLIA